MSGGYKGRRGRRSVTYPPANMQTTPTLLLLLAGLAMAFPGNTSHYSTNSNNCVEIINYGEVEYTASQVVACGYETRRQCRPRSKVLCEEVVVEEVCQLKGSTDCEERTLTVARQEARPARQVFTPQQCRRGEDVQLVETKQRVECHTVTRPQCDSRWEVDPATGEITAGSPSASLSFGSNLSLTVSEGETARDKPTKLSTPVRSYHMIN